VAAYNPRNSQQALNSFSGRGTRLDGLRLVDIGAPGSTVYSTTSSSSNYAGFRSFGGTSSAGPHIAGACALLLQLLGINDVNQTKSAITQSADVSFLTGTFPNDTWGYGRIRIRQAAEILISSISSTDPVVPSKIELHAYPNPFNNTTRILFSIDKAGSWQVTLYNTLGQKVYSREIQISSTGQYGVNLDLKNRSSGLFFVVLEYEGNARVVKKITYIK
jgi:subtilisin family serine protease